MRTPFFVGNRIDDDGLQLVGSIAVEDLERLIVLC